MPRKGGKHAVLVKGAEHAVEKFKYEVAQDLGLSMKIDSAGGSYKGLTTVEVGQIRGEMVRRIQAAGEWAIKQRYDRQEARLMPEDVLPDPAMLQGMTNNGNPTISYQGSMQ